MPFKYSCFISYRHGQNRLTERIINDLSEALSAELAAYFDKGIYLDKERLKGGAFFNEQLSMAICESVCLIVVYTPVYFSAEHPYCTREYKAMEKLEELRLRALNLPTDRQNGLIIPIVFRGADELPEDIKTVRHYYDFQDFDPTEPEMIRSDKYYDQIRKIARYIYDRYRAMMRAKNFDPCNDCSKFPMPSEDEAKKWLERLEIVSIAFPMREGDNR
jgi:TIR domain